MIAHSEIDECILPSNAFETMFRTHDVCSKISLETARIHTDHLQYIDSNVYLSWYELIHFNILNATHDMLIYYIMYRMLWLIKPNLEINQHNIPNCRELINGKIWCRLFAKYICDWYEINGTNDFDHISIGRVNFRNHRNFRWYSRFTST